MTLSVLLAHGSPDPRSGQLVRRTADQLSERLGSPVVAAFLDHEGPDLAAAVTGTSDEVAVLPLLLSSAYHARVDVPEAVASLDRRVSRLAPLGHPASVLDNLLLRAGGRVVVVAAGTKVDEERAAFATSVVAASLRTGVPATSASAAGPGPRLDDVGDVDVVVPWLLAPGRLMDVVHASAAALGRRVDGHGLLLEPTMLDVLTILLQDRPNHRAT
jgi:sirohydrochlorin ferrochelatase